MPFGLRRIYIAASLVCLLDFGGRVPTRADVLDAAVAIIGALQTLSPELSLPAPKTGPREPTAANSVDRGSD